ncbi:NEDD8-activating enzyme E1 regulatory subunit AltName: Full=Amyloid beta precursor protein-binding protein 1, 59 kDa; Short=APP-BP1; AltName: Full=Amyloid protein-binding protein 1; AltName: Full=Proto-oncogene protein 1 [Serendipita indica DSM 11827]|nr:NEDD8-activating enzyme E1 regulatory subunit AltName: Full=Amyloid beta precursor protein-binding protein 1, 59 kDa; Short=APP-BP1; AltName: Full=Amyloid protein-binding protein 1; AltName: Full=Proto-oncogene protein 1 [Serendipita indica DSM 11827]
MSMVHPTSTHLSVAQPATGRPSSISSNMTTDGSVSSTPTAPEAVTPPEAPGHSAATNTPPPAMSLWTFWKQSRRDGGKPKKLTKPSNTPKPVASSLQPTSTQLSTAQQDAGGLPGSSSSSLTTRSSTSATSTASQVASTSETPRQAHAESSTKYEKANDLCVLILNIVKDFSESNGMFAPLKATCALLIRGLETTKALHDIHAGWDELLEDLQPWLELMKKIKTKLDKAGNSSSDDGDLRQAVDDYTKVVNEAIEEVVKELEKLKTPEFKTQAKRLATLKMDQDRMKRIRQKLYAAHKMYSMVASGVTFNKIDSLGTPIRSLQPSSRPIIAGLAGSSSPNSIPEDSKAPTLTPSTVVTTPEAPRQTHAESSKKYKKASAISLLICNIVKDFSESDEMFAPLKATFALLIRGLETAEALDNIHTGWDELLEDLEPWISLMAWIRAKLDEKSNPSSDDEDFRQAVNNYTKVVIEAIKEVLEELEKLTTPEFMPQAKRLGTLRIDPERMKRIRQKLQEAHNRYSTSVGFVTNNKIDVVGEGISKLRVEVRHALDIKDLPALVAECTITEFTYGFRSPQSCLPETRTDLLAKLKQWDEDRCKEQFFWVTDKAGSGKTTVAATKASHWQLLKYPVAQLYCPPDMKETPKVKQIIRHLAAQLLSSESIRELATRQLRQTSMYQHDPPTYFRLLISEPLQALHDPCPIFFILDAVDNLGVDEQEALLRILANEIPNIPSAKVLITSRRSLGTIHDLKRKGLLYGASEHPVASETSNAEDLQRYVNSELPIPKFSDDNRNTVVRYCAGQFEVAVVVCEMLVKSRKRSAILAELAEGNGSHAGIDGVHANTLHQAFRDKRGKDREDALQVLQVLVTSFEPLSIEGGFSHLLDRDEYDRNDQVPTLLSQLQELAVLEDVKDDLKPLVFKNKSFKEFVCSTKERAGDFYVEPDEAHSHLGRLCIQLLSGTHTTSGRNILRYDLLDARRQGYRIPRNSDIKSDDRLQKTLGEGWRYAAKFWLDHILAGWVDWAMIQDFLSKHFLHWIELASWMGTLDSIIASLLKLQEEVNLEVAEEEGYNVSGSERLILENLSHFLKVGLTYVRQYRDIFAESALHVYTFLVTLEASEAQLLSPNDAAGHKAPRFISSEPILWDSPTSPDSAAIGLFFDDEKHFLGTIRSPTYDYINVWWVTNDGGVDKALLDVATSVASWATNGKELVSVGPRGLRIYDLNSKSPSTKVLTDFSIADPEKVLFSVDGQYLAISSAKATQVWNYETNQLVWKSKQALGVISFAPSGDDTAIAGQRGDKLVLCDLADGTEYEAPSSGDPCIQTAMHPTDYMVAAVRSQTLEVWEVVGGKLELAGQAKLENPPSAAYPLHFAGKRKDLIVYGSWTWSLERTPNRRISLTKCDDDRVTTCELDSKKIKHSMLTYHDGWIHSAYHAGPIMPVPPRLRPAFDAEEGLQTLKRESTIANFGQCSLDAQRPLLTRSSRVNCDEIYSTNSSCSLWAATGQAALEGARLLVIGATATSTSLLKNLVLPGIGHFTILDPNVAKPEDVGNNFFLEYDSIGKQKAVEAARLLSELNESVQSAAEVSDIADILEKRPEWLADYTLVLAHNLPRKTVDKLAAYLWSDPALPPLFVVKTAGFLGEFYVQCHEHTVIESHIDDKPSLRIDNPFPALQEKAMSIDLANLDQTTHAHVPFIYILIQAAAKWRAEHNDTLPKNFAERKAFQGLIEDMKMKFDEENFDEAAGQIFRVNPQRIPSDVTTLFDDPALKSLGPQSKPFFHLLSALKEYVLSQEEGKRTLPLSATLPDIKSDTKSYVEIQTIYKTRATEERNLLKAILVKQLKERLGANVGGEDELLNRVGISERMIDDFVKNSHGLRVLRSKAYGALDKDPQALGESLMVKVRETAVHLAFAALDALPEGTEPTVENLRAAVQALIGKDAEITEEIEQSIGEIARAPTADLPTTASFVGGLVAQEAIKLITKQYIPQVGGYVVVDLIGSWTGVVP